jgi:ABC-type branched-subunit amino acid transport system ATPase component
VAEPDLVLAATGLEFAYGGVPVLHGADLAVRRGEVLALVGPNGAGKTTLLRVLAGLERPSAGTVDLDGVDVTSLPTEQRAGAGMAVVFGGQAVFGDLSVDANLQAAGELLIDQPALLESRIASALELFPRLAERRAALAVQLSGGEQQMLAVAKALLLQPKVLCIDELSLGLAPVLVDRLLEVLRHQRDIGTTVLLVEQSVRVALAVADRCAYFERGEIRAIEDTAALVANPKRLRELFFGEHAA